MMLGVIRNPHNAPFCQVHTVPIPPLCPVSHNPAQGTLTITYYNTTSLLDVTTLTEYIASFTASHEHRDIEAVVWAVARDVATTLNTIVTVRGVFILTDGQTVETTVLMGRP